LFIDGGASTKPKWNGMDGNEMKWNEMESNGMK
jgi:hypothetical protein